MKRILINQMQILSAIFPSITWSQYLPSGLIQLIAGIAAIFTVDFSALFTRYVVLLIIARFKTCLR
jgi:hypothetical protein